MPKDKTELERLRDEHYELLIKMKDEQESDPALVRDPEYKKRYDKTFEEYLDYETAARLMGLEEGIRNECICSLEAQIEANSREVMLMREKRAHKHSPSSDDMEAQIKLITLLNAQRRQLRLLKEYKPC